MWAPKSRKNWQRVNNNGQLTRKNAVGLLLCFIQKGPQNSSMSRHIMIWWSGILWSSLNMPYHIIPTLLGCKIVQWVCSSHPSKLFGIIHIEEQQISTNQSPWFSLKLPIKSSNISNNCTLAIIGTRETIKVQFQYVVRGASIYSPTRFI